MTSMQAAAWRNRITRHADVDPTTLQANGANWRTHPKHQADAPADQAGEGGAAPTRTLQGIT